MAVQLRIQLKGDTAENWTSKNTVLLKNELGYDSTTNRIKFGNGVTAWNGLPYVAPDVINDLITGGTTVALSAEQGKILKVLLDSKANSSDITNLINEVKNGIQTVDIINVLTSDRTDAALSAAQGKELKAQIDTKANSSDLSVLNSEISNLNTSFTMHANLVNSGKLDAKKTTHETWVFTLEDESTVDKEVMLWNS